MDLKDTVLGSIMGKTIWDMKKVKKLDILDNEISSFFIDENKDFHNEGQDIEKMGFR